MLNLFFIVGTGRCGSSFIHEILSKHEEVGFISNVEDNLPWINLKGRYNNFLFRTSLGKLTQKGKIRFAPSEGYRLISRQVSPLYANSSRDLVADDVTPWLDSQFYNFFLQRYEKQRKKIFLHKYTGWSRIGFFLKIFPEAKFIHVMRDGRAVANSWLQMPWWGGYRGPENWLWGNLSEPYLSEWHDSEQSYITLSAIGWKILMNSYEQASRNLTKEQYLFLRCEDFLINPYETMENLLSFIGLPFTAAFENHFRKHKINPSRIRSFERDLTSEQLEKLECSLNQELIKYGYL